MTTKPSPVGKQSGKDFSWKARGRSFRYAWAGIRTLVREEHNMRLHLAAAGMAIAAGMILRISLEEWAVVAVCIGAVTMAEGFNSAVEALADKVSAGQDPLIGKAKDLAAGAVLLMAVGSAAAGFIIFLPKLIALFLR